ncbi:TPA: Abi family protein [Streptococcus suis]|nr:Abi family protein [Streptococcus suis]
MKQGKTIDEQLSQLKERGLDIPDYQKAYRTLQNVNYYTITGYLFPFKDKDTGHYHPGTSVELAITRYYFDSEMRTILMSLISEAEEMLKTRIAYNIAVHHKDDPLIYTDVNYWKSSKEHQRFMTDFQKSIANNSEVLFVKHHINKYRGQFPIWVAVNLLTLGNLKYLYKNIPSRDRKNISRELNLSPGTLDSWIDNLRILRNKIAHNMRLYGVSFINTPRWEKHHTKRHNTNKLFVHVLMLRNLLEESPAWETNRAKLVEIMNRYSDKIQPIDLGFPDNWLDLLN